MGVRVVEPIRVHNGNGHILYPIGPLVEWLDGLVRAAEREYPWASAGPTQWADHSELGPHVRVATRLGITPDQLRNYRRKLCQYVEESALDQMCCNEGSTHPAEIYPTYWDIAEAGGPKKLLRQLEAAA